jgi:hypothetical protein
VKRWQRRYFFLQNHYIHYAEVESHNRKDTRGCFDLAEVKKLKLPKDMPDCATEGRLHGHSADASTLELELGAKSKVGLRASTPELAQEWARLVNHVLERLANEAKEAAGAPVNEHLAPRERSQSQAQIALGVGVARGHEMEAGDGHAIALAFKRLDTGGTGWISMQELSSGITRVCAHTVHGGVTAESGGVLKGMLTAFEAIDTAGDGQVSELEFSLSSLLSC